MIPQEMRVYFKDGEASATPPAPPYRTFSVKRGKARLQPTRPRDGALLAAHRRRKRSETEKRRVPFGGLRKRVRQTEECPVPLWPGFSDAAVSVHNIPDRERAARSCRQQAAETTYCSATVSGSRTAAC
jgi:hypothetical protein